MPDNKKAVLNLAVALTSGWAAQQTRALLYSCNTFRVIFVSGIYGLYRYGCDASDGECDLSGFFDYFMKECALGLIVTELALKHKFTDNYFNLNLAAGLIPLVIRMADYQDDPAGAGLFDILLCVSVGSLLYLSWKNGSFGRDWFTLLAILGTIRARFMDFFDCCLDVPKEEFSYYLGIALCYVGVRAIAGSNFDFFGFLC